MTLYTVERGDTLYSVSQSFGVPAGLIAVWNAIPAPYTLVVGQCLLILTPSALYTVRAGDTYSSISARTGVGTRELFANNPNLLGGTAPLYAGQTLVISFEETPGASCEMTGYAYPFIETANLYYSLPYLTQIIPFTYGFRADGSLVTLDDERILSAARSGGTGSLMHLSTLTEGGNFSSELALSLFSSPAAMDTLARNVQRVINEKGYDGLDIDFEFIPGSAAADYADFIRRLRALLAPDGKTVIAALAPKTRDDQPGVLYEGHDYSLIGEAADAVLLMTYEWGYTYGPPMAVSPISAVRSVLDYAVSRIPREKIYMGLPNYAYDWILPYKQGYSRAVSIGNDEAVDIARRFGAEIKFDETAKTPYFTYYDGGITHEVWFEDARSMQAKFDLIKEYGFRGGGYWNVMRRFAQGFLLQNVTFGLQEF
ncbi:MAG: LysM peptidoglycan-binding domain-containing protein [Clostridia bacterium]|nr:LysM peptidoglycan-binding domain-containing protein [Clostridia bacterium]